MFLLSWELKLRYIVFVHIKTRPIGSCHTIDFKSGHPAETLQPESATPGTKHEMTYALSGFQRDVVKEREKHLEIYE